MRTKLKTSDNGFISLEISLALIVSALIFLFVINQQARAAKAELARIQADQLIQVAEALNSYTDLYRRKLAAAGDLEVDFGENGTIDATIPETPPTPPSVEGSKLNPTITDLINVGLLPDGFTNSPVASNGKFTIRLSVEPLGCSAAANDCRIEGYVVLNKPVITSNNNPLDLDFDGDVLGDMLSLIGGNGFATLMSGPTAKAVGGNIDISLDLDGDGSSDSLPAGLVGIRVGALANRFEIGDPIAEVDYCPGEKRTIFWPKQNGSNPLPVQAAPLNDGVAPPNQACIAYGYSDIPAGYSFTFSDGQSPSVGAARVRCIKDPANPGKVIPDYPVDGRCN